MKFIFGMQINIEVFFKLILSFSVCIARHAQSTQSKKFAYLCSISRKTWEVKLIFSPADKHECFLQIDRVTFCVGSQACPKYPK